MRPVLIDLGMAHYTDDDNYLFMKCGTPGFIAPEIFELGSKSPKGDLFSLGVIFHILYVLLYLDCSKHLSSSGTPKKKSS